MSQHDMDIANGSGATFRADLNSALLAMASCSSGATAPSTTFAFQYWADTANDLLKQRNEANTAWISLLKLSTGASLISQSLSVVTPTLFGYGTGSGGTVTQATNKSTAVTLNKPCGIITMNNAPLAAGARVSFLLNNSLLTTTTQVLAAVVGNSVFPDDYAIRTRLSSGSAVITVTNTGSGSLAEPFDIGFTVIRGVAS